MSSASSFVRPGVRNVGVTLPASFSSRFERGSVVGGAPEPGAGAILSDSLRTSYLASLLQRPDVIAVPIPEAIVSYRTRDLLRSRATRISRGKTGRGELDPQMLSVARSVVEAQLTARGDIGDVQNSARGGAVQQPRTTTSINVARVAATEAAKAEAIISITMAAWGRLRTAENLHADAKAADRLTVQSTYSKNVALYAVGGNVKAHLNLPTNRTNPSVLDAAAATTMPPPSAVDDYFGSRTQPINTAQESSHLHDDEDVVMTSPLLPAVFKRLPVPVVISTSTVLPASVSAAAPVKSQFPNPNITLKTMGGVRPIRDTLLTWWDSGAGGAAGAGAGAGAGARAGTIITRRVRDLGDTESPASRVIAAAASFVQRFDANAKVLAKAVSDAAARYNVAQAPEDEGPEPSGEGLDLPKWPRPPLPAESQIANALRPGSAIPIMVVLPPTDLPPRPSTAAAAPAKGSKEVPPPVPGVVLTNFVGGFFEEIGTARVSRLEALRARVLAAEIKRIAAEKKAAKAGAAGKK